MICSNRLTISAKVFAMALASCGGDPELVARGAGGQGGTGGQVAYRPGAGGMGGTIGDGCDPTFQEPDLPCLPPPKVPIWSDLQTQVFPAVDANCGEFYSTYWLTGDESVRLHLRAELGAGFDGSWVDRKFQMLIDGQSVPARFGEAGPFSDRFELRLSTAARLHEMTIEVPAEHFACGAHSAALIIIDEPDNSDFVFGRGFAWAVMANGTDFPPITWSDFRQWPADGPIHRILEDVDTGEVLGKRIPYDGRPSRRLRLRQKATIHTVESNVAILAFLDGERIPLGELGSLPIYRGKPNHWVELEWTQHVPTEPGYQSLVVMKHDGYHQPAEDRDGTPLFGHPSIRFAATYLLEGSSDGGTPIPEQP